MDRDKARSIAGAVIRALKEVETQFDVSILEAGGTFSNNNFVMKLQIAEKSATGEVITREVENFKTYCRSYGLAPEDLGKTINYNNKQYKIVGLKPQSHKYPIVIASCSDLSDRIKMSASWIKTLLK